MFILRNLTDFLYSTNLVVNWVKKRYPDEEIMFSSSASILETKEDSPVGWSFKRFAQKRGILVLTREQIFLWSSFYSLFTIFYLAVIVGSLFLYFRNSDFIYLLLAMLSGLYLFQRLPYKKRIAIKDIQNVRLTTVQGATGQYPLLTFNLDDRTFNVVTTQYLSDEIKQILSLNDG